MKYKLPILVMEKILKKSGAKRISENSKKELRKQLEKKAIETSEKAKQAAEHAGRKTVKEEDINLVLEN